MSIIDDLADVRTRARNHPEPADDAPLSEHGWYLLAKALAAMMTLRFWLLVAAVALAAAVLT